ncbi:RNA-binding protein [Rhizobium sp. CRIBSB]|nr:RNA-binding protein [Rhizobium sp. CRIBSB]
MSRVEVFLDELPGETRGIIGRDGRFTHILIEREGDEPRHRLGARSVGRVVEVPAGLKAAFVDLGAGAPLAFLPLKGTERPDVGEKVEIEVTAEPREGKGPTIRMTGPGEGEARLLMAGPTVRETLAGLAPGIVPVTGIEAIQASWDSEEEAAGSVAVFPETGLDLAVERTRAMVTVDLDLAPGPGVILGGKARERANRQGLREAARLISLKRWGGLVAIDLIGVGHDGEAVTRDARAAFGSDPDIAFGPVNRFGVLQLALPWRRTPLEEIFHDRDGRPSVRTRALALLRRLNHRLLSDTTVPGVTIGCTPDEAAIAGPLAARLGPRARVRADAAVAPGGFVWDER